MEGFFSPLALRKEKEFGQGLNCLKSNWKDLSSFQKLGQEGGGLRRGLKGGFDLGNFGFEHFDFARRNFESFGFEPFAQARLLCPLGNNEQRGFARKKAGRFGRQKNSGQVEDCFGLKQDLTKRQGLTKDF